MERQLWASWFQGKTASDEEKDYQEAAEGLTKALQSEFIMVQSGQC